MGRGSMNAVAPIADEPEAFERVPPVGVKWHPYSELFPWIEGAAFDDLKADIAANGIREPIVFLEGQILDGRNRYMAARDLGIDYPRTEYSGDDPLGYVISLNLRRRHLTESQRAMVASRLAKMPVGRPQDNAQICAVSQDAAAETLGVSRRSVQTARTVEDRGVPDLVAAVDAGTVSVSAAAEVAKLPIEEQRAIVEAGPAAVREAAKDVRENGIVNRTSFTGNNEWYTPAEYIDAARSVLGGFDLDPASSIIANETVGAKAIYTEDDDGLTLSWHGSVWLNPPYAQPAIGQFIEKACHEFESGAVDRMIVLTHNYTDTRWFQQAASAADAICFTKGRIRFESPTGEKAAPTQGQAFFYFGDDVGRFHSVFSGLGFVVQVMK